MAEKGDLPSDQVSLPPTYAPSEAYTESPPPAYKRTGMAAVRVAKIICITVLFMTFIIGFAVVAHKWIQLKECNCSMNKEIASVPLPLVAGAFGAGFNNLNDEKEEQIIAKSFIPLDDHEFNNNIPNLKDQEVREMKKLKLPIDMLLDNPSLAGKAMPCNVEKRKQKIADGIFTETVIVTCENEDKIDLPFFPLPSTNQGPPPLSLLSHIIKALASRPKSQAGGQERIEAITNSFPKKQLSFGSPITFGTRTNEVARPFPLAPGMVHIVPIKKFEINRPNSVSDDMREIPLPFARHIPQPLIKRVSIHPINLNFNDMQQLSADSIPRAFHKFIMPNRPRDGVNSLPIGRAPIKIIKIQQNEFPQRSQFPFSPNPFMKLFPIQKAKILRVMPRPIPDHEALPDYPEEEEHFNQFHSQIEIINHDVDNFEENVPEASGRSLPSPRVDLPGIRFIRFPNPPPFLRSPDSRPITHMELRTPLHEEQQEKFDLFPPPVLPVEEEGEEFGPPKIHTVIQSAPEPIFRSGPPSILLESPGFHEETVAKHLNNEPFPNTPFISQQTEPISLSQLQPRFFVPPPPRFAREGRSSPFIEINPEAEVYTGPNNHHVILN